MAEPNRTLPVDGYVPILKGKQGELGALNSADPQRLLPLVEVIDCGKPKPLANAWQHSGHALLVQPINFEGVDDQVWTAAVSGFFDALRSAGVETVPVVTADEEVATLACVASIVGLDGRGAAIRLDAEDLALANPAQVTADVDDLLQAIGLSPADVDLIIDVGLVRDSVVARVTTAEAALRTVPYVHDWRNLVTAFSAFPEKPGEQAGKGAVTSFPRDDAQAFVVMSGRSPERMPTFGDYAVGVPTYADGAWLAIPSIKYTDRSHWHMHRATTKNDPSPQYRALAGDVTATTYYRGPTFSDGDRYYSDVVNGADGPGNATSYVRAHTSHHLAHVLDSLATLGVP